MRVIMAREVGFCFGVKRAINLTRQALSEREDVCILGDLIHNRAVTSELEAKGLRKVTGLDEVNGATMVVRAHGLPAAAIQQARDAGVEIVDATCPIVGKAQAAARTLEERGLQVVVVGDADHPEIRGIVGALKEDTPYLVVDSVEDVRAMHAERRVGRKVGVVFQTTHSLESCQAVVSELMTIAREVQIINTVCRPVRNRQLDAVDLACGVDVMIVVGSKKSANTMELKHLLESHNPNTIQIENADQLELTRFKGDEVVGIASGLSTPEDIVEGVRVRLMQAFNAQPAVRTHPQA